MNRNLYLSFIFVLLITISIVNAIPHKLHKRVTTFGPCPELQIMNEGTPLAVTVKPDPLVPGKSSHFTVDGPLTSPAKVGSTLAIGFFDSAKELVAPPLLLDVCSMTSITSTCPISSFAANGPVEVPAKLPYTYTIVVAIFDPAGVIIGCAEAAVGAAMAPALKYSTINGGNTPSLIWTK